MPSVIDNGSNGLNGVFDHDHSTLKKRKQRVETVNETRISSSSKLWIQKKWKSPRICISSSPNSDANEISNQFEPVPSISMQRKLSVCFPQKSKWNPKDSEQMSIVKEVLHLSSLPSSMVCREEEQKRVLDFCKACIEQERAGSLYVCGCPGTGKTLSMEKMKQLLLEWVKEEGFEVPDVLTMNCTSVTSTCEIFCKILERYQPQKKANGASSSLQYLQNLFSRKQQSSNKKMMLILVDELDYLITRDQAVLHDLFMLTTFAYSRCILIGIANAIDLADRFLPRLQLLNCKPTVVTFCAYSKDQILRILQQRLMALPYDDVFQPQALELCARKVAAASGDMRKALSVCRGAIDMLEAELRDTSSHLNSLLAEDAPQSLPPSMDITKLEVGIVKVDHMAIALSRTFKSGIVDIIQSLPQHQQIILCSAVKLFRRGKKDTIVGEMNKSYSDLCKSAFIPPAGSLDFSNMCKVLTDQGLLRLGQSRDDKMKRVTLKVDEADITFALQVPSVHKPFNGHWLVDKKRIPSSLLINVNISDEGGTSYIHSTGKIWCNHKFFTSLSCSPKVPNCEYHYEEERDSPNVKISDEGGISYIHSTGKIWCNHKFFVSPSCSPNVPNSECHYEEERDDSLQLILTSQKRPASVYQSYSSDVISLAAI